MGHAREHCIKAYSMVLIECEWVNLVISISFIAGYVLEIPLTNSVMLVLFDTTCLLEAKPISKALDMRQVCLL